MSARITSRGVNIVNPGDSSWARHRYLFALGAYGWTKCLVWANDPDSALDGVAEWCAEHAPGLLADNEVQEAYQAELADGYSEEEAWERATVDVIQCDMTHCFLSWEVQFTENPSRAELLAQGECP